MLLSEIDRISDEALPLDACKAHLRLGIGFSDDGGQDGLVLRYLRAAIAAVETHVSKSLLLRTYSLRLTDWRDPHSQDLSPGPVKSIDAVTVFDRDGDATLIEPSRYRLHQDMHRSVLRSRGWLLPTVPTGGAVEVVFRSGFGPNWEDIPDDLAQAVFLLVAHYHEHRHPGEMSASSIPSAVRGFLNPWRAIRGIGGRT